MFSTSSEAGVGMEEEVRIGELFEAIERRRLINGSEGVGSIVERLWYHMSRRGPSSNDKVRRLKSATSNYIASRLARD